MTFKWAFLIFSFVASVHAEPTSLTLVVRDMTGHRAESPDKPLQVGSAQSVGLYIDFQAPEGSFDQMTFRLQAATDSPYADAGRNNVTVQLRSDTGALIPADKFTLTGSGGGGGLQDHKLHSSLNLWLKIPTERNDRIARAKSFYEKALATEKDKVDPRILASHSPDEVAAGVADYLVDSKPGTYTVSVTLNDPVTGKNLTSNVASFTFVDQGYPPFKKPESK